MTDAPGTVIAIAGEHGEYAVVGVDRGGCGRCHEPGGCGAANIGKMLCTSPTTFRVLNTGKAVVGARVTIAVADGAVQKSALIAYGLPLSLLLTGALAGSALAGDAGAIAGALVGLAAAWFAARALTRRTRGDRRFQPFIRC